MINVTVFELKKIRKNRRTFVIFTLMLVYVLTLTIAMSSLESRIIDSKSSEIEFQIESTTDALEKLKVELLTQENNNKLKNIILIYKSDLSNLSAMKSALASEDYKSYLSNAIEIDERLRQSIEDGVAISYISVTELSDRIDINKILLERDIKPIELSTTVEGLNFIKILLTGPFSLLLTVLLVSLISEIASSEFDDGTYKLLYTQPVSKNELFFGKLTAALIVTISMFLAILISTFVMVSLFKGMGNLDYPLLYTGNGMAMVTTMSHFIFVLAILQLMIIVLATVISVTFSVVFKENSLATSSSIIFLIAMFFTSKSKLLSGLSHLNPFTYLHGSASLDGTISRLHDNFQISMGMGLISVVVITVVLLIVSNLVFKKSIL